MKVVMDGVLDGNHEQENMPSANGKASPQSHSLSGSRLTIQSVRGCWDHSPMHHVGLSGREGHVSSQNAEAIFYLTNFLEVLCSLPPKTRLSKASFPP